MPQGTNYTMPNYTNMNVNESRGRKRQAEDRPHRYSEERQTPSPVPGYVPGEGYYPPAPYGEIEVGNSRPRKPAADDPSRPHRYSEERESLSPVPGGGYGRVTQEAVEIEIPPLRQMPRSQPPMSQADLDKYCPRFSQPAMSQADLDKYYPRFRPEHLREYKNDGTGVYLINQGVDKEGFSKQPGFCGVLPSERCPINHADIGWQAELKIQELQSGKTRAQLMKEICKCDKKPTKR